MGRRRGRAIDGVLALDKPTGISSNAALQRVRGLFRAAKAGHTGSLDPAAAGVLPLCFGRATRFAGFLLAADKSYRCRCRFGERTDTGDAEGEIIERRAAGAVTAADLESALEEFRGVISQTPPMYSAVKVRGQPLYRLARRGIEIERPARTVRILRLQLRSFSADDDAPEAELEVRCSKGVYIRTLVDDIGRRLGCGAHVVALRRTQAGGFRETDAVSLETLEELARREAHAEMDALLRPIERAVAHLPEVRLPADGPADVRARLRREQFAFAADVADGPVRICLHNGEFIGVGELREGGALTPLRLAPV